MGIPDVLRRLGLQVTATYFDDKKSENDIFCRLIEESGGIVAAVHNVVKINLAGFPGFADRFIGYCEATQ